MKAELEEECLIPIHDAIKNDIVDNASILMQPLFKMLRYIYSWIYVLNVNYDLLLNTLLHPTAKVFYYARRFTIDFHNQFSRFSRLVDELLVDLSNIG